MINKFEAGKTYQMCADIRKGSDPRDSKIFRVIDTGHGLGIHPDDLELDLWSFCKTDVLYNDGSFRRWYDEVPAKTKIKRAPKQLFVVASRDGMIHKALVNQVNKRGLKTLGLSPLQSLSKYEDEYGKKIDLKNAVAFKLVPYSLRLDKKTGKPRLDKQIGYSKER